MLDINNAVSQSYHPVLDIHFAKGYLDHSRIGLHGLCSKFTSSWCLCLPNPYPTFIGWLLKQVVSGRCLRRNWIP